MKRRRAQNELNKPFDNKVIHILLDEPDASHFKPNPKTNQICLFLFRSLNTQIVMRVKELFVYHNQIQCYFVYLVIQTIAMRFCFLKQVGILKKIEIRSTHWYIKISRICSNSFMFQLLIS